LEKLPGRKLILTNGTKAHADAVMRRLAIHHHFEDVFDIIASELQPKPFPENYDRFLVRHGVDAGKAAMFEDLARNLAVPHALGMTTVLVVPEKSYDVVREGWELEGRDALHVDHITDDLAGFWATVAAREARRSAAYFAAGRAAIITHHELACIIGARIATANLQPCRPFDPRTGASSTSCSDADERRRAPGGAMAVAGFSPARRRRRGFHREGKKAPGPRTSATTRDRIEIKRAKRRPRRRDRRRRGRSAARKSASSPSPAILGARLRIPGDRSTPVVPRRRNAAPARSGSAAG
jgi:hypothetical protein